MTNAALRTLHTDPVAAASEYLGPARVIAVDGRAIEVRLPSGQEVPATMALVYPYTPAVGDTLLVIGRGESHYVIGVIEGEGRVSMDFAGDVELRASGELSLHGERGVKLRGPKLEVVTDRMRVIARAAVHSFATLTQRVRELLDTRAGESRTVVEGSALSRAKRTTVLSEETTTVDGKTILIG